MLYRDGVTSTGEPVTAVVQGDVPVEGRQLTCVGCHQRSGMGSSEGSTGVPPISGPSLYAASDAPHRRPAYTDETVARAIRDGIDSAGRSLTPLMPRYRLGSADVRALVEYLKTLSGTVSPGVTADTIRFATIVTDGVDPTASDAMLEVLTAYFAEKNGTTRHEPGRAAVVPDVTSSRGYRKWELSRWTLHGPPSTWSNQLEDYYRSEPVFAVVAGLAAGEWRPIHEFCERVEIPCLLPNTDLPAAVERDTYTLYFSRGVALEAQALAAHISRRSSTGRVVQIVGRDGANVAAARALRDALAAHPNVIPTDLALAAGDPDRVTKTIAAAAHDADILVLWLSADEVAGLADDGWIPGRAALYVSSTLLGGRFESIPRKLRPRTLVAHPFVLPGERPIALRRLQAWLTNRGGTITNERIQAQTYFACLVLGDAIMHMKWLLYRDYLLDTIDHGEGLALMSSYYPRVGFGPGQRYLAKGCYILALGGDGADPSITSATWQAVGG